MLHVSIDTIQAQIVSVLAAWGMPADQVATTAELMVEADARGIGMLPQYHDRRNEGKIIVPGEITVVKDLPAMTFIDAGHALGYVPAKMAMQSAILCSMLTGSNFGGHELKTGKHGKFTNIGSFFLAIDPVFFRSAPGAFEADMDVLIDQMHGITPMDPAQPVLVPGEPEEAARAERLRDGVPMTDTLYGEVKRVAEESGVPFIFG